MTMINLPAQCNLSVSDPLLYHLNNIFVTYFHLPYELIFHNNKKINNKFACEIVCKLKIFF